jgi:hypothetical protein
MPAMQLVPIVFRVPAGITGQFTGPDVVNQNCSGLRVVLDMTVNAGGLGSVQLSIQSKDPASGNYSTILQSAAITTVSTNVLRLFPLAPTSATSANAALPAVWRVIVSGNGSPTTYTVGAEMLP